MSNANEGKIGFWAAVWRFVSFYNMRKSLGIMRAADAQFTSTAAGVRDGWRIRGEAMKARAKEMITSISQLEMVIEQKKQRLAGIDKNIEKYSKALDGALAVFEKRQAAGDVEGAKKAKEDGTAFLEKKNAEVAKKQQLLADIKSSEEHLVPHKKRLQELSEEVRNLDAKEAESVARFIAAETEHAENERLLNLQKSTDRDPVDAIEEKIRHMEAEAKVSSELAGVVTKDETTEYMEASVTDSATSDFEKLAAARKAEKDAKTGAGPTTDSEDRPNIIK